MVARSERRQHAGEDLESQVLFVAEPVGATLEHADLVVQPLDEAERDLVLRAAIGRDPIPVPVNHRGELLVGLQALPLEGRPPVLEEAARPTLPAIVPELAERFLEQVGGVQPLVGGEQGLECPAAAQGQVLAVRQQGPAGRSFDRRARVSTRVCGSPKIPTTVELGRNPAKRYVSHSGRGRRGVGMRVSCPILAAPPQPFRPLPERVPAPSAPCFHPLTSTKSLYWFVGLLGTLPAWFIAFVGLLGPSPTA